MHLADHCLLYLHATLHRDWPPATSAPGLGLAPATSAPGLAPDTDAVSLILRNASPPKQSFHSVGELGAAVGATLGATVVAIGSNRIGSSAARHVATDTWRPEHDEWGRGGSRRMRGAWHAAASLRPHVAC